MTDAAVRGRRIAWAWIGALLIATGVLQLAGSGMLLSSGPAVAGPVIAGGGYLVFAAALMLAAFGWRGRDSLVSGQPAGRIALVVLAVWTPLVLVGQILLPHEPDTHELYIGLGYLQPAVALGASLVAVVAIGRAGVVPSPWHWAPGWGLAVVAVARAVPEAVAVTPGVTPEALIQAFELAALVSALVPLLLGVLALVLAQPITTREAVQIFPPSS